MIAAVALYTGPVRTIEDPKSIPGLIDHAHPSFELVRYLINRHPYEVTRDVLRKMTGTAGKELYMAASFEWRLLRANDTLPFLGWRIATKEERYRLEKLKPDE